MGVPVCGNANGFSRLFGEQTAGISGRRMTAIGRNCADMHQDRTHQTRVIPSRARVRVL